MTPNTAAGVASASITAKVFRIDWHRKPSFIPTAMWLWLGKKRYGFAGHWEHLGEIASSDKGTATVQAA